MIRTYSELIRLPTFEERFEYLKLSGVIGESTFGYDRYLNQELYRSRAWKRIRDMVIIRDNGDDLALEGYPIGHRIIVHHMNPVTIDQIIHGNEEMMNPEYLICVSLQTHNAIHYGDEELLPKLPLVRRPGDTCPWK